MRIHVACALFLSLAAAVLAPGCGGGAADDPRCKSLCTIKEPSTAGAGDICSEASADSCREQCGAQIQDESTLCGDCLLEDAHFGITSEGSGNECFDDPMCPNSALCNDSGPGGQCTWCDGDDAAEAACYKKAHPRREVECKVDFRDPAKCTDACSSK